MHRYFKWQLSRVGQDNLSRFVETNGIKFHECHDHAFLVSEQDSPTIQKYIDHNGVTSEKDFYMPVKPIEVTA